jgi:hypothetical protein
MLAGRISSKPRLQARLRRTNRCERKWEAAYIASPHLRLNCYFVQELFRNTGTVWPQLYKIALCELNANKIPDRIAAAETALVRRARELFHQQETISKKSML